MEILGLSEKAVCERIKNGQTNKTDHKFAKSTLRVIFDNWFTLFNLFNALIGVALALVGAWLNMAYLVIIVLNAVIGTVQELNAKRLVARLTLVTAATATAIREGREVQVGVDELVLDDVVVLVAGNQVPADAVVLSGTAEVDEALLTGEADCVQKAAGDELLSGSYLTGGRCVARLVRVGADSFVSGLTREAKRHKRPSSEILQSMKRVTYLTSFALVPIGVLLFCVTYFGAAGLSLKEAVVSTAAALLGMLPKGLVLISTIALFSGVVKLSKKKALVQELHAIEVLGRVDLLCLDKTGTLTTGKMRVEKVVLTEGAFRRIGGASDNHRAESLLRRFVEESHDDNATMRALKEHFSVSRLPVVSAKVLSRVHFSSDKKWSGISFEGEGSVLLGAAEVLGATLPREAEAWQNEGGRVVCVGFFDGVLEGELPADINFFAFVCLADPVRKDAKSTLDYFAREGVGLKIISGDSPLTVSNVAREAGLADYKNFVDMSKFGDGDIAAAAQKYSVFCRTSPHQKRAIVAALKAAGHTVAMTGDGVNDLPALREADCGIALRGGSDAVRNGAEIVLVENDFSVLPEIVVEGRRVLNNVTRVSSVFFIKTIYSVLLSIFCIVAGLPFPFIPLQITLIDAAIEAYPSFFLSFVPDKARVEKRFLPVGMSRAFPYAVIITLACLLISMVAPYVGLSGGEAITVAYYLVGFFTVLALFRSCVPLDKIRLFLCVSSCVGFFVTGMVFHRLLGLAALTVNMLVVFGVVAVVGAVMARVGGQQRRATHTDE